MLLEEAAKQIKNAKRAIAFTGAGISVESGIPPFRGPEGLWSQYDPIVLDLSYFKQEPEASWKVVKEIFYDFFGKAKPNPAHIALAKLEKAGYLDNIITQNIDNLHQEAGSQNIIEFHGTSRRLICLSCYKTYNFKENLIASLPPACSSCNGLLKPDFIFFSENISTAAFQESITETKKADLWLIIGTTGEVMPASSLPTEAKNNGASIIEINVRKSNYTDYITDIFLEGKAGEILNNLSKLILKP